MRFWGRKPYNIDFFIKNSQPHFMIISKSIANLDALLLIMSVSKEYDFIAHYASDEVYSICLLIYRL